MPESTIAIAGVFAVVISPSDQNGRTPDAVGHSWFELGTEESSTVESCVIVRPGFFAMTRIFFAFTVTATELTNLYESLTPSELLSIRSACLKAS